MDIIKFNELGLHGPNPAWGIDAGGSIIFRCRCGNLLNLTTHGWVIDSLGKVSPSIDHSENVACNFHDFVQLKGYNA